MAERTPSAGDWPVRDLAAAAALLAVAGAYGAATQTIAASSLSDAVGERGLPNILTALLVILALAIAGKALVQRRRSAPGEADGAPILRALGFLAIGAGYIALAPLVGYGVGIALLIAAVALYEGLAPGWRIAAVAAVGGLLFYLGFVALLGVEQPMSLLIRR